MENRKEVLEMAMNKFGSPEKAQAIYGEEPEAKEPIKQPTEEEEEDKEKSDDAG